MTTDHDQLCLSRELLPADLARFCDCERVTRIRERIATEIEAFAGNYPEDIWPPIGPSEDGPYSTDRIAAQTMRHACRVLADVARGGTRDDD